MNADTYRKNRAAREKKQERSRRIKTELENIVIDTNSTTEQKLEAARLLAKIKKGSNI